MVTRKQNRASDAAIWLGMAVGTLVVSPHLAYATSLPCRGFSGADYSRERLLSLCGEPDEILEQETKRLVMWRYKGYPSTIISSNRFTGERGRVDRVSGIRSSIVGKNASIPQKSAVVPENNTLFLSILDEAAAVSEK
jgi:hypothetical protein